MTGDRSTFTVSTGGGDRLDAWIAETAGIPRTRAQKLIDAGLVRVDGAVAAKSWRVIPGQVIDMEHAGSPLDPPGPPAPYKIRFLDEHLLIVAKPPGVVVHPAPGTTAETLVEAIQREVTLEGGMPERPGVIHRLDKDTSGLLVLARTEEAYNNLVAAMKSRRVERTYAVLVLGGFQAKSGRIEAPVGRSFRNRTRMGVVREGKPAATEFVVVEEMTDVSLVEAKLVTGRTHQIRVHFAHLGHPVIGDRVYGAATITLAKQLGLERPFLHAAKLLLPHPASGEIVEIVEPLPEDLQAALTLARASRR